MSVRKIKPFRAKNSGFIQKVIDINRVIPTLHSIEELEENYENFSKIEYLALYQSLKEKEIWDNASWEERAVLAPIVDFFYDEYNCPVLVFPRFSPVASEEEACCLEDDECIPFLNNALALQGMEDGDIGKFIETTINVCTDFDLNEEDILYNLSNIGYNSIFSARILDYGVDSLIMEEFNEV